MKCKLLHTNLVIIVMGHRTQIITNVYIWDLRFFLDAHNPSMAKVSAIRNHSICTSLNFLAFCLQ